MFLTVTANPMVEHLFRVPHFESPGDWRPAERPRIFATGKPLNVGRALQHLGESVTNVVAAGGCAGREIEELLAREGAPVRLVALRRESRRGFAVYDERGQTTTVYGPAPRLEDNEVEALLAAVRALLPVRFVVVGGSSPRPDLYPRLCALGAPMVLDCRGPALIECLKDGEVALAKPNLRECQQTFGVREGLEAVRELHARGARAAVVTDEDREAWFLLGGRTFVARPPKVQLVHAIGCGDAVAAGLLHRLHRPGAEAVAFAMACGAHAASRPEVSALDPAECARLAREVSVEEVR